MMFLRSLVFNLAFYVATVLIAVLGAPLLAGPASGARRVMNFWAQVTVALLRLICGVRVEVRGLERIPPGASVLASKHQSAFDTIIWLSLLPDVAYVIKKDLLAIPFYGWYARKAGMIPVDREGGGPALRGMLRVAQHRLAEGRAVLIFPEGTRTTPGVRVPYLPGVVAIAGASPAPVLPVATDSGRVWGRRVLLRRPGVIRISVLPPLPPGLSRARLLAALEEAIEGETDRLYAEEAPEPVDKSVD